MAYCLGVFPKRQAKYLMSMIRENKKNNVYVVLRGRGSRKEHGNNQDLPVRYADNVAMYVRSKADRKRIR